MNQLILNKKSELAQKKKKGFTLVELIIVIAIIAVLAAVAIPKFGQITKNANIKADIANAKNLHGIAAQYIAEEGNFTAANSNINSSIVSKVDGGKIPTSKVYKDKPFIISVDADNNISVYVETQAASGTGDTAVSATSIKVYPNGAEPYNIN